MAEREFEVVVHGATGFTGTLVCEYLCKMEGLRWAISGRSQAKLEAIRDGLQDASSLPKVLVVSVTDKDTLEKMTGATKVVLSTAGPYARIGTPVVEACMTTKTDYCDITGEIAWVRKMMDRFGEEAKQKNILLVSCCGFDSAPSDLSTLYGVQKLREKYGADTLVGKSTSYVVMHGGLSGGTLASGINMEKDPELARMTNDPFLLGGAPKGDIREGDKDVTTAKFEENIGAWTGPFGMAKINTRIVRRSSDLLKYGPDFMYNEVQIAKSQKQAEQLARGGPPPEKREEMVKKGRLPAPGQGPSKELRAKSFFRLVNRVEAKDDPDKAVYVKLAGGDPGYTETAKMVSEAALCLARKRAVLPQQGGYLTPATAMGSHLIESLVAAGISFEQVPPPSESATSKL